MLKLANYQRKRQNKHFLTNIILPHLSFCAELNNFYAH